MLATLREGGRKSKNYWLISGEAGTFKEATTIPELVAGGDNSVFGSLVVNGVVMHRAIQSLQEQLESLNFIDVRYPREVISNNASRYWHTDERIWIVRGCEPSPPSAPLDVFVLEALLDLLIGMPDKDVSPAAQRQREVYYYHAHLLIRRVIWARDSLESRHVLLKQAVFIVFQLLTHRYQVDDSLLLDFVRNNSVRSSLPDMNVMLLWAELKEKAFRKDYDGLCTIRDRALILSKEAHSHATSRQNGLLGFLLVDLVKNAKTSHFENIVADAVKMGTDWADSTQKFGTGTRIEKTALCEVLVTLDIHDRNDLIQEEYYLFYGYHLSRAGFLEQGAQILARALKSRDAAPLWSYEMERVSIALRLGRQNEAAQMLKSLRELVLRYEVQDPNYWDFKLWIQCGECAEVFVLLNLYEADCSASTGRLDDACAKLKSGISITSSVYDAYIRILRITLEMRLLEILMRQGSLEKALPVATNLASEILDERTSSNLAWDVVYGTAQQLLDLSNALLSAGNAAASMELLKSITSIGDLVPGELFEEFKPYVEQRMAKARQFTEIFELLGHDLNASRLDIGVEDPKSLVQAGPNYEPAIPASASLDPKSSHQNPPKLPNPTKLQTNAQKRRERDKQSSTKALFSKMYASTIGKSRRAPRSPSTEPDQ